MNKYEIMMIFKPDLEENTRNEVLEGLKGILTSNGGIIDNVSEEMGMRDLAYEIKDYTKGYYVVLDVHVNPDEIAEFERLSRINANVLRHLTLRRD
ncbi:ribosomal protein S6 [Eggerthia catenaformis OT 569 = DSM 20559]|uniref:Small ribosomal subunit protein bS6 n=1 Tax=Eggerthia catenaformis OT 569 = DSM 20559 TaxID=999415 RepID=M2P6P9_9FIRM|nr:30S ribosomal protein S6 [Eggerthia catenaformis]EMD15942.1 ribosomal protein S6 [Eggerthia catenaformis OT 569 = DSM 20559]OUC52389.1 30S ribosomal protein S6 [Eggerthia catenaformis]